jgi:hypothetical protein
LNPAQFDSQGLQQPPEVTQAILAMLTPGLGAMAQDMAASAPRTLAGEAGAIFPEGVSLSSLPQDKAAMQELGQILSPTQQLYRRNEALANWHAQNMDFPAVLRDKWALLKNAEGS